MLQHRIKRRFQLKFPLVLFTLAFNRTVRNATKAALLEGVVSRVLLPENAHRKLSSTILRLKITDSKYQGMPGLSYFLLTEIVLLTDCDVCRSLCSCYVDSWNTTVTDCQGRGLNTALLLNSTFPTTTQIL